MGYSVNSLTKCSSKQMILVLIFLILCFLYNFRIIKVFLANRIASVFWCGEIDTNIKDMKYVLLWNKGVLSGSIGEYKHYLLSSCLKSNCMFTSDRKLFGDNSSVFNAIIYEKEVSDTNRFPLDRVKSQLYVFASFGSSSVVPVCEHHNDNFFNWTFTYRLDSDIPWTYFVVRDKADNIVAPSRFVKWRNTWEPINQQIRSILYKKTKAVMWYIGDNKLRQFYYDYITNFRDHLYHYGLEIDLFDAKTRCHGYDCSEVIKNDYYFCITFENSVFTDFVTDKVVQAYKNYAVPIVFGGANYTRFLPPGSYVNAQNKHPYNLAYTIYQAVTSLETYEKYFYWRNHYTIDSNKVQNSLCSICQMLHSERSKNAPAKKRFRIWWNGRRRTKWCSENKYRKRRTKLKS